MEQNNLILAKEQLNEISSLNQRVIIEIEKDFSIRIGNGKAIFENLNNGRKFETKSFNKFKAQINNFFNVQ